MRTQTNKLLAMMAAGEISAQAIAEMALSHMSEADVADMMRSNDILDQEDEADGQPSEAEEWAAFDADC